MLIRKNATGFTLIELLVVLAIITSLLMLAVPRYFNSVDHAKEVTLVQNLKIMRDTVDKYYGDTGQYPDSLQQLVDKNYLRSVPMDPLTGRDDTWVISPPPSLAPGVLSTKVYDVHSGALGKSFSGQPYSSF